ncbi:unnamed protein product [Acanthocheilonema viteae]|uniref:Uncharacterized protein n=1 Tax=Acanthocheilonema viteae TaxID=6277 RepID=A0A498SL98_ACAVI|nr:unnamed protein product [Acanthocheilonema viteae]
MDDQCSWIGTNQVADVELGDDGRLEEMEEEGCPPTIAGNNYMSTPQQNDKLSMEDDQPVDPPYCYIVAFFSSSALALACMHCILIQAN